MYLSWAAYYEGPSDRIYFDILLPRVMEEILLAESTREVTVPSMPAMYLGLRGREIDQVAQEACDNQEAFDLLFIHTDTGGRALATGVDDRGIAYCEKIHRQCNGRPDRCVVLAPRHETEAWALADPDAVVGALGYKGGPSALGLPVDAAEAERLDPKGVLEEACRRVQRRRARRGSSQMFSSIAQIQSLTALRRSTSFQSFEGKLRDSLKRLGYLVPPL